MDFISEIEKNLGIMAKKNFNADATGGVCIKPMRILRSWSAKWAIVLRSDCLRESPDLLNGISTDKNPLKESRV